MRNVLVDPEDAADDRGIVALGKSLGPEIIAEGIEDPSQAAFQ